MHKTSKRSASISSASQVGLPDNLTERKVVKEQKFEVEKIMSELKKTMRLTQGFWSRMPGAMCTNTASKQLDETIIFDASEDEDGSSANGGPLKNDGCWNGEEHGRYDEPVVGDGLGNQVLN